jgi:hypothetical protein
MALLLVLLAAVPVFAQEAKPPKIAGVRVGLADRYKVGLWTQVEVTLDAGSEPFSGELSLTVPDGDGVPSRVSTPPDEPCHIAADGKATVRLLCRFGRVKGTLAAELRQNDAVVAHRTFETAAQADVDHFLPGLEFRSLIVTVGDLPIGVEDTGRLAGLEADYRPVAARIDDVERLPTHWSGYEGVDAVILSTSRPEIYAKLKAQSPQMRALDEWIRMGGRLVICVGSQAERIISADSPLQPFVPGQLEKMIPLRQLGALESYCGSRSGIPQAARGKMLPRVPRLGHIEGSIEAHEADLPLVVRTARGFGQILFLAADLDRPPLMAWTDRPMLLARLLDMPTGRNEEVDSGTAMMHFGYSDLSGQLRSALDRFEGVRLVPFWLVAGLIVVYLLLIGPADYLFLGKVVRRMQWTWLTFSLVVLLTCVGACVLAYRFKGDELKVNQAEMIDVDAASGLLRGAAWMNVFSPRMESFDLSIEPRPIQLGGDAEAPSPALPRGWLAWLGLPGAALGGMNPRAGDPAMWSQPYRFTPNLNAMEGVPIQVWSTKSFCSRWSGPTKAFPAADLTDENQYLVGSLVNTFDIPLEQCILAYGRSVYEVGTIGPGEAARIGPMTKRTELKTLLTGRKVVFTAAGDKYQHESTPYDQSSTDLGYILRAMMFYDEAGGQRYTGLWNSYQSFVDLSDMLKADRAILVTQMPGNAKHDARGARLLRDGAPLDGAKDRHVTVYRFLFPVKK